MQASVFAPGVKTEARRIQIPILPAPITSEKINFSEYVSPYTLQSPQTSVRVDVPIRSTSVVGVATKQSIAPILRVGPTKQVQSTGQKQSIAPILRVPVPKKATPAAIPAAPQIIQRLRAGAQIQVNNAQDIIRNADQQLISLQNRLASTKSEDEKQIINWRLREIAAARDKANKLLQEKSQEVQQYAQNYEKFQKYAQDTAIKIQDKNQQLRDEISNFTKLSKDEQEQAFTRINILQKDIDILVEANQTAQSAAITNQQLSYQTSLDLAREVSNIYVDETRQQQQITIQEINNKVVQYLNEKSTNPQDTNAALQYDRWRRFRDYVGSVRDTVATAELNQVFVLITQLATEINDLEVQKNDLINELKEYDKDQDKTIKDLKKTQDENEQLKQRITFLESQLQQTGVKEQQVVQQVSTLNNTIARKDAEIKQLQDQIEQFKAQQAQQNTNLEAQKIANQKIEDLLKKISNIANASDVTIHKQQIQNLVQELQESGLKFSPMLLENIINDLDSLQNVKNQLDTLRQRSEQQIQQLQNKITETKKQLADAASQSNVLEQAKIADQNTKDQLIQILGLSDARKKAQEYDNLIADIRMQLQLSNDQRLNIVELILSFQSQIKSHNQKIDTEQRYLLQSIANALGIVIQNQGTLTIPQQQKAIIDAIKSKEKELITAKENLRQAQISIANLEKTNQSAATDKNTIQDLQNTVNNLKKRLESTEALNKNQANANKKLQDELDRVNVQAKVLQDTLDSEKKKDVGVQQNLNLLNAQAKVLEDNLSKVKAERDNLVKELNQLQEKNQDLTNKLNEAEKTKNALDQTTKTITDLREQIQQLTVQSQVISGATGQVEQAKYKKENQELKNNIKYLESTLTDLIRRFDNMVTRAIDKTPPTIRNLEQAVKALDDIQGILVKTRNAAIQQFIGDKSSEITEKIREYVKNPSLGYGVFEKGKL